MLADEYGGDHMVNDCGACGLAMVCTDGMKCYLSGRAVSPDRFWQCHFFSKKIMEDGQPLTPEQHYLIKKSELNRLK